MARHEARFAAHFRVRHYEMDALGHVNNAVYLHYLEQAAIEHVESVGFPPDRLRELGGVFIARRHEIEYLRPASAGDLLQVVTWRVAFQGARALRAYEIYRLGEDGTTDRERVAGVPADGLLPADYVPPGKPLVLARTEWIWVDVANSRPRRLPAELLEAFPPFEGDDATP
jgi:acyl-CoA thioester hydrolase